MFLKYNTVYVFCNQILQIDSGANYFSAIRLGNLSASTWTVGKHPRQFSPLLPTF